MALKSLFKTTQMSPLLCLLSLQLHDPSWYLCTHHIFFVFMLPLMTAVKRMEGESEQREKRRKFKEISIILCIVHSDKNVIFHSLFNFEMRVKEEGRSYKQNDEHKSIDSPSLRIPIAAFEIISLRCDLDIPSQISFSHPTLPFFRFVSCPAFDFYEFLSLLTAIYSITFIIIHSFLHWILYWMLL